MSSSNCNDNTNSHHQDLTSARLGQHDELIALLDELAKGNNGQELRRRITRVAEDLGYTLPPGWYELARIRGGRWFEEWLNGTYTPGNR